MVEAVDIIAAGRRGLCKRRPKIRSFTTLELDAESGQRGLPRYSPWPVRCGRKRTVRYSGPKVLGSGGLLDKNLTRNGSNGGSIFDAAWQWGHGDER